MSVSDAGLLELAPMAEEHLDAVSLIEHEAYPDPWTTGMLSEEITSPQSHFFVALLDDTVVGYGGFWFVADEAHITSVTVHAGYRGRGLGRRILLYLLRVAIGLDAQRAFLEVRESNAVAQKLYESVGFRRMGVRKQYYAKTREDAIVMDLCLAPPRGRRPL